MTKLDDDSRAYGATISPHAVSKLKNAMHANAAQART